MASAQAAQPFNKLRTSHSNASSSTLEQTRRASLASVIPISRPGSQMSHHSSRPSRSPMPPTMGSEPDRTSDPSTKSKTPSTGTGISSQHSSLSGSSVVPLPRYNSASQPKRRLKSQYPRGSTENHVEYILVASFDIDRGPVMEHQYPMAITGDEHMLAELMLPDQAHMRNQDWTIFFLHKDTSQEEEDQEKMAKDRRRRRRRRRRDRAAGIINEEEEEEEDDEQDAEDGEDDSDFDDEDSADSEPEGAEGPPLVYVLNLVNTKQDKTVKRGAVVKAMAICTRHPFLHIYKVSGCHQSAKKTGLIAGLIYVLLADDANEFIALITPGLGGILQITSSGNAGHALRLCECHGPVPDAQTHLSGKATTTVQ